MSHSMEYTSFYNVETILDSTECVNHRKRITKYYYQKHTSDSIDILEGTNSIPTVLHNSRFHTSTDLEMKGNIKLTNTDMAIISERVIRRINESMSREEILSAIKNLARSQGSYGRMYQFLTSGSEEAEDMLQDLEDQCFKDTIDMVMYLEG